MLFAALCGFDPGADDDSEGKEGKFSKSLLLNFKAP